jgi:membrane protease YdiL (CAAX protease family)
MENAVSQPPSGQDIWLVLAELAVVTALFVADVYHHVFFSKTPYLFLLGWTSLRWRGMRWKDVGFTNFTAVHSNLKLTLIYLVLIWGLAAFGEELVYRGYLMTRLAGLLRGTRAAWVISLVIISIVFGCSHTGQGATGMLENVWDGLLLGTVYLACGRNLTAAIVAHGVTDTVDLLLMYLGKYPGMR